MIARWAAIAAVVAPAAARADRPTYDPAATVAHHARPDGHVRVHCVTTTVDAVPGADGDRDGVPDFVEEVAERADHALDVLVGDLGFRAPRPDGALGGDARLDVYLRDLELADGNFGVDTCTTGAPTHCAGYLVLDNDFARFSYPSVSLAIRVLTSDELFHAIQGAYDADQPIAWTEGTAVWAEEVVYPEQDDFERLVAHYLERQHRPFDRPGGGFGDLYPYGAALWPYFLDLRFGDGVVRDIWAACEDTGDDPDFLVAADAVLAARGSSLAAAWIEHTRWNAETGRYAAPGRYPDAGRFAEATREAAILAPASATLSIEGMSARYLPIVTGEPVGIVVDAEEPVAIGVRAPGAEVVRVDGEPDGVVAAHHELDVSAADVVEVIVTGVRRGRLPRDVTVTAGPIPEPAPPPEPGDTAGCASAPAPGAPCLALVALLAAHRQRRTGAAGGPSSGPSAPSTG